MMVLKTWYCDLWKQTSIWSNNNMTDILSNFFFLFMYFKLKLFYSTNIFLVQLAQLIA